MKKIQRLIPVYKSIIWGGSRLKERYNKMTDVDPLAESWELSAHRDGTCSLEDGTPFSEVPLEELGENCSGFSFFPVLVKLIDANAKLSVQVHPGDDYALAHENSLGKSEMWYIADADEGAGIYLGFKEDIGRDVFERAICDKTLTDYLNFIPVKRGECYFIPSGTIHAICEGCLICEIQQNSNITYRVYDYGRVGKDGRERELHVKKALDVTKTEKYRPISLSCETENGKLLGISRFFTATRVEVTEKRILGNDLRSFRCITCLDGEGFVGDVSVRAGDSVFVPAGYGELPLSGRFGAVMTTVRKYYLARREVGDGLAEFRLTDDDGVLIDSCVGADCEASADALLAGCGLGRADVSLI